MGITSSVPKIGLQQTKVGIIGGGVVGHATARCWMEHAEVRVNDVDPLKRTHLIGEVLECDVIFLCLPTPQIQGSLQCDLSVIETVCYILAHTHPRGNYVLRSTVPIGTTRRLAKEYGLINLVHSPEFLTARCAVVDACTPSRNLVGIPEEPNASDFTMYEGMVGYPLYNLYRKRFPHLPTLCMSSDESEAVKIVQNSFFAVKVGFFNEARSLCDKLKLDWDVVINGILADGRISSSHTTVPGPDGLAGYGGSCLPKDIANFAHCNQEAGLQATIALASIERNESDRSKPTGDV